MYGIKGSWLATSSLMGFSVAAAKCWYIEEMLVRVSAKELSHPLLDVWRERFEEGLGVRPWMTIHETRHCLGQCMREGMLLAVPRKEPQRTVRRRKTLLSSLPLLVPKLRKGFKLEEIADRLLDIASIPIITTVVV